MAKLSPETQERIRSLKDHYPQRRSAVMPALQEAQAELGYLADDTLHEVAALLEVPPNMTFEVVSFYSMFDREKKGKYQLQVCRNLGCALQGSLKMIEYLEQKLGIKRGETTPDGRFTLLAVECLGACGWSPMMMIDGKYYEFLDRAGVDAILDALKEDKTPPGGPYTAEHVR